MDRGVCAAPARSWRVDFHPPARCTWRSRGFAPIEAHCGISRPCALSIATGFTPSSTPTDTARVGDHDNGANDVFRGRGGAAPPQTDRESETQKPTATTAGRIKTSESRRFRPPLTPGVRNADDPDCPGMTTEVYTCFATVAREKIRFELRPTRLSPRHPKSGQMLGYETGPDKSKTSQPHRSG